MGVEGPGTDGWGIGFYQGGEVLLRRRPKPPEGAVDFYQLVSELATDVLIGEVFSASAGTESKSENTPPYRFRSWLFADCGAIPGFGAVRESLLATIPDVLRRNIRGQTDTEQLFHLFLAHLWSLSRSAGKIDDALISTHDAGRALAKTIEQVGTATASHGPSALAMAAANGRILVAASVGKPIHFYRLIGMRDCPVCREPTPQERELSGPHRTSHHDHLRSVVLAANGYGAVAAPWEELPDRHLLMVSRELELSIQPL